VILAARTYLNLVFFASCVNHCLLVIIMPNKIISVSIPWWTTSTKHQQDAIVRSMQMMRQDKSRYGEVQGTQSEGGDVQVTWGGRCIQRMGSRWQRERRRMGAWSAWG
jgi:hypothetical protein